MSKLPFRTVEVSDPRFETEGLRQVTVKSAHLRGRGDLTLWIPDQLQAPAPLVILLHGVYGSHWAWAGKGGAHRTARALIAAGEVPPMVLAMPSDGLWGDGSGYVPHQAADFERWIIQDVPTAAGHIVGGEKLQPKFFLAGLSMGGWGALRLGAKYGKLCAGISGHSSITDLAQMKNFVEEDLDAYQPPLSERTVIDPILAHRAQLPPLRFDCGVSDTLLPANRDLHRRLDEEKIAHRYTEFPGAHEWSYWEEHLADTLRFFAGVLNEKPGA